MPRSIKIDFYKTENQEGESLDISNLIRHVSQLGFQDRRVDFGDSFIFLHNVRANHGNFLGEVVKARMTDLPDKVNRNTGLPQDLGLTADEGIGRHSHFLYDAANHILLLQRDREVRPPAFAQSVATPTNSYVELSLIFRSNAMQRLNRMRVVRRLSFKVARTLNPGAFRGMDASAAHAIDLLNDVNGRFIDISISVGRSRDAALERQSVLRAARTFFGRRGEEVQKIVVSGKEEAQGAMEVIDLFEDRLVYEIRVELRGRRLDPAQCEAGLLAAHREHVEYLRNYRHPE